MSLVRVLFAGLLLVVVSACGDGIQLKDLDERTGRLSLPLQAEAARGVTYRLTQAVFTVTHVATGASVQVNADEHPGKSAKIELPVSEYKVKLASQGVAFTMLKIAPEGPPLPATNVELTSPAEVQLAINAGEETRAVFHFLVDGLLVKLGGDLVIEIEVVERTPAGSDAAGQTDMDAGAETDAGLLDAGVTVPDVEDAATEDAGPPRCGDGMLNLPDEDCDDGNELDGDGCSACVLECICGDFVPCVSESCDDGNLANGDGCSAECVAEGAEVGGAGGMDGAGGTAGSGGAGGSSQGGQGGGGSDPNPNCVSCLDENVPDGLNQACTADPACAAVRKCVVDSDCFRTDVSPSVCYCGTNATIEECQAPSFAAPGACATEIVSALSGDGLPTDNASVLANMALAGSTSGQAFGILIPASQFGLCIAECSL